MSTTVSKLVAEAYQPDSVDFATAECLVSSTDSSSTSESAYDDEESLSQAREHQEPDEAADMQLVATNANSGVMH
eukprot:958399-Amphidinium_carterae.1